MDIRKSSDDFFTIGNIAILHKTTGNDGYDFNFRNCFECKSVVTEVDAPVLLHIGAIEDYAGVEAAIEELGMKLLIHEAEHIMCSTIEKWYPSIKERTPHTQVYDELPPLENVLKDFSFPFFVKGNRQTNHHKKSQCIIENADQYEALRSEWGNDKILNWQKAAIRDYVPLKILDSTSFPDSVPISYEFRFFYFEGRCMAYGPYWTIGPQYTLSDEELPEVLELTDWAAERLGVSFPAIDVAKTTEGDWIIIEVNDAQESGFVGVNPFKLWNCTIDKGKGISFNVYCYNVQPGVIINYADGSNKADPGYKKTVTADEFIFTGSGSGTSVDRSTSDQIEAAVPARTNYVVNTNSGKFHDPSCDSVKDMKEKNKMYFEGTRDELIQQGYDACNRCNP